MGAAVLAEKTTARLASDFGGHTSRMTAWQKRVLDCVTVLLADARASHRDISSYFPLGHGRFEEFTRECLAIDVARSVTVEQMLERVGRACRARCGDGAALR